MTFTEIYKKLPGNGWLSEPEAKLLHEYANACDGPILEVGSYKGRSSVLLALTCPNSILHCVDPFCNFDDKDESGNKIMSEFQANIHERKITNVRLWHMSIEWWKPRQVDLAYLDGDHTAKGTRIQIAKALACNPNYILIHDVNDSGGGLAIKQVAEEILGPFHERVERLAAWIRKGSVWQSNSIV